MSCGWCEQISLSTNPCHTDWLRDGHMGRAHGPSQDTAKGTQFCDFCWSVWEAGSPYSPLGKSQWAQSQEAKPIYGNRTQKTEANWTTLFELQMKHHLEPWLSWISISSEPFSLSFLLSPPSSFFLPSFPFSLDLLEQRIWNNYFFLGFSSGISPYFSVICLCISPKQSTVTK